MTREERARHQERLRQEEIERQRAMAEARRQNVDNAAQDWDDVDYEDDDEEDISPPSDESSPEGTCHLQEIADRRMAEQLQRELDAPRRRYAGRGVTFTPPIRTPVGQGAVARTALMSARHTGSTQEMEKLQLTPHIPEEPLRKTVKTTVEKVYEDPEDDPGLRLPIKKRGESALIYAEQVFRRVFNESVNTLLQEGRLQVRSRTGQEVPAPRSQNTGSWMEPSGSRHGLRPATVRDGPLLDRYDFEVIRGSPGIIRLKANVAAELNLNMFQFDTSSVTIRDPDDVDEATIDALMDYGGVYKEVTGPGLRGMYTAPPAVIVVAFCHDCYTHGHSIHAFREDPQPFPRRIIEYAEHPCVLWSCTAPISTVCFDRRLRYRTVQVSQNPNWTSVSVDAEQYMVAWDLNQTVAKMVQTANDPSNRETENRNQAFAIIEDVMIRLPTVRNNRSEIDLFIGCESKSERPAINPCIATVMPRITRILNRHGAYMMLEAIMTMAEKTRATEFPYPHPLSLGVTIEDVVAALISTNWRSMEEATIYTLIAADVDALESQWFTHEEKEFGPVIGVIVDFAGKGHFRDSPRLLVLCPMASLMFERNILARLGALEWLINRHVAIRSGGGSATSLWPKRIVIHQHIVTLDSSDDGFKLQRVLFTGAALGRMRDQFALRMQLPQMIATLHFDITLRYGSRHHMARCPTDPHIFTGNLLFTFFRIIRPYIMMMTAKEQRPFLHVVRQRNANSVTRRIQKHLRKIVREVLTQIWELMMVIQLDPETENRCSQDSLIAWMRTAWAASHLAFDDQDIHLIQLLGMAYHERHVPPVDHEPEVSPHEAVIQGLL